MYDWQKELEEENKKQRKRWNGKVITTGRQWSNNADGSMAANSYDTSKIWDSVRDYRESREWN